METTLIEAPDPHVLYARRLEAHRAAAAVQERRHQTLANLRLGLFVGGGVLAWLAIGAGRVSAAWIIPPALAFVALVVVHGRVARARGRAERAAALYEWGLARLEDRWVGRGEPGERYRDPHHPYAEDLDLFGVGSLFERLCTARTTRGREVLADWLRAPAPVEAVRARQGAVAELAPRLDLREDLALLGAEVPEGLDLAGLAAWGAAEPVRFSSGDRAISTILGALATLALIGWFVGALGLLPLMVTIALEVGWSWRLRDRIRRVLGPVERRSADLALLSGLLARIEGESLPAPELRRLQAILGVGGVPASRQIARLIRLVDWLNARRNQLFAPFAVLMLWDHQLAFRIEAWRAEVGRSIAPWIDALGEAEALGSLAAFAFENPDDPFPEVVAEGPLFVGEGLTHPLLPKVRAVRNDLRLGGDVRMLVVSGSNMSGKSTLLRTVGANAVLAQAGAPVRARRLTLSPLALGASLRIHDSLQAGQSRFYAEVLRIRQVVDLAGGPIPLIFLLDEIFHGTNSHDRRAGAEAVVRTLLDRGAIGLVTTHDLALAAVADRLAPRAANVHFEDHFEGDKIAFDYRMRPGVVTKSNALALMRAVGLDV